ncbi:MAG: sigma-70 family RNA polymerase sigma factor [Eubacteriales bacterium]|nr:sigma-70 family RNA polymerase sigma factor [Eubacteriales bacterium]
MAYNKAREEKKWKEWKEQEEKRLRELGMDEASIQVLHEADWKDFNSDRRYQEHQTSLLEYMEILLAEKDVQEAEIQSVEELLEAIGDEQLLHILLEADRKTLQIIVLKMMGYTPKEISLRLGMPEQTVYTKIRRIKGKIKKFLKSE